MIVFPSVSAACRSLSRSTSAIREVRNLFIILRYFLSSLTLGEGRRFFRLHKLLFRENRIKYASKLSDDVIGGNIVVFLERKENQMKYAKQSGIYNIYYKDLLTYDALFQYSR